MPPERHWGALGAHTSEYFPDPVASARDRAHEVVSRTSMTSLRQPDMSGIDGGTPRSRDRELIKPRGPSADECPTWFIMAPSASQRRYCRCQQTV